MSAMILFAMLMVAFALTFFITQKRGERARGVGRCAVTQGSGGFDAFDLETITEKERVMVLMCDHVFSMQTTEQELFNRALATTHPGITMQLLRPGPNKAAGQMFKTSREALLSRP